MVGRSRMDAPVGTSFAPSTSTKSRTSPTETIIFRTLTRAASGPEAPSSASPAGPQRPCADDGVFNGIRVAVLEVGDENIDGQGTLFAGSGVVRVSANRRDPCASSSPPL